MLEIVQFSNSCVVAIAGTAPPAFKFEPVRRAFAPGLFDAMR